MVSSTRKSKSATFFLLLDSPPPLLLTLLGLIALFQNVLRKAPSRDRSVKLLKLFFYKLFHPIYSFIIGYIIEKVKFDIGPDIIKIIRTSQQ